MKRWGVPADKRRIILSKTNGNCFYCGIELTETKHYDEGGKVVSIQANWHVDHVKPLSKGGTYDLDNLVPACPMCNMKKGARYE